MGDEERGRAALALTCYGSPAGTDFIRKIDHPGAPPMLLVGTRGDPATPYEWTKQTAERLGSGVVLHTRARDTPVICSRPACAAT
ncbi:alpha/beta hydrolase [Streptomyces virginiae]|uniref:alpha/beta hydrolase n=1 Tax=Streptomyces virginiae TaxID=1961 RepID=UPI003414B8C0